MEVTGLTMRPTSPRRMSVSAEVVDLTSPPAASRVAPLSADLLRRERLAKVA